LDVCFIGVGDCSIRASQSSIPPSWYQSEKDVFLYYTAVKLFLKLFWDQSVISKIILVYSAGPYPFDIKHRRLRKVSFAGITSNNFHI